MTVSTTEPIIRYLYQGPGDYAFPFETFKPSDISCYIIDEQGFVQQLVYGTDFTALLIEGVTGGTASIYYPTTAGGTLEIRRELPITQEVDWVNNDPLDAETLEDSFDRLVMILQQQQTIIDEGRGSTLWKGKWRPTTYYSVNDLVTSSTGSLYVCSIAHTSSTDFSADLAAGNWKIVLDLDAIYEIERRCEQFALDAEASAAAAATSAANSANAAAQSQALVSLAAVHEANAATAAQNAANCSQSSYDYSQDSLGHADNSQLRAWESEAERLTADSYANQLEDVPVDIFTSNGDGTFTATPTNPAEYSAFHWKEKASEIVTAPVTSVSVTAPILNTGSGANPVIALSPAKITEWDAKANAASAAIDVDPNASLESYFVSAHANGPAPPSYFHFYQKSYLASGLPIKNDDARFQRAVEYRPGVGVAPRTFVRIYNNLDDWSPWKEEGSGGGGGGGGLAWQTEQSVDFTAEDGKGYPMLNGCTMTLPAVPTDNMQIGWKDFDNNFNTTPCFIDPGTNPIENLGAAVMELNTRGQGGTLVWITDRWLITDVTEMTKEEEEPQGIKRVQRIEGTIALGTTITHTIDAVDMNKTFLAMNFMGTNATYCKLINSVTVRLWTETVYNYNTPCPYSVEIVEFY